MVVNKKIIQIAKGFSLVPKKAIPIKKGVYQLILQSGESLCLKKMNYPSAYLMWIDRILQKTRKSGFLYIAWRNPASTMGHPLFIRGGSKKSPYILTPWIKGRTPSPHSKEDLFQCAAQLAHFHNATRKFMKDVPQGRNELEKWSLHFRNTAHTLTQVFKNDCSPLLLKWKETILSRAETAIAMLKESDYLSLCRQSTQARTICHGDSGPKNFVIAQESIYLIDFETLRIDLRVYDLFRMIRLSCKNTGWDFTKARTLLDGYRSVADLNEQEIYVLSSWFCFPHKAGKLLHSFLTVSKTKQGKILERLDKIMAGEEKLPSFIQQLQAYGSKVEQERK